MRISPATPSWPSGVDPVEHVARRTLRAVPVGVGALVLLATAATLLIRNDGGSGEPPGGSTVTAETVLPATAVDPGRRASLRPTTTPTVEPLLQPPAVTWRLFAGVALPFSQTDGPRLLDGPMSGGFSRTEPGALIAAVQIGTRYLLTGGQGWRQVTARQVLPGVGRDVYVAARAQVVLDDPPGSYGQLAGFRVVAFTPDVAVLQLVSRFALSGQLQLITSTVKWVDGDWRLELQPDGGASPTAQAVADLDGFVVWSGV